MNKRNINFVHYEVINIVVNNIKKSRCIKKDEIIQLTPGQQDIIDRGVYIGMLKSIHKKGELTNEQLNTLINMF